jgi:hypothetical protein
VEVSCIWPRPLKNQLEIRIAVIVIPCVLIILSIPLVAINFGTIEHIKQNPRMVSLEGRKRDCELT